MHPDVFFDMGGVVQISAQDKFFECTSMVDTCVNLWNTMEIEDVDYITVYTFLGSSVFEINWGTQLTKQILWQVAFRGDFSISSIDQTDYTANIPDYLQF